jgi:hypothetical protein
MYIVPASNSLWGSFQRKRTGHDGGTSLCVSGHSQIQLQLREICVSFKGVVLSWQALSMSSLVALRVPSAWKLGDRLCAQTLRRSAAVKKLCVASHSTSAYRLTCYR